MAFAVVRAADSEDEATPLSEGEVATALKIIEDSRRTHVEWVDYLSKFGADLRPHEEIAGDAAHHREAVEGYDRVLAALRSLPERVPEGWQVKWTPDPCTCGWCPTDRLRPDVPVLVPVGPDDRGNDASDV
jgi:hypothetical protein